MSATVEPISAPFTERTRRHGSVEPRHEHGRAVHHGRVDYLASARPLRLEQAAEHTDDEQHAAAAEVADQVQWRDGGLAGPADVSQAPGQGDVVDVVSGGLGIRAFLAPTGH